MQFSRKQIAEIVREVLDENFKDGKTYTTTDGGDD